MVALDSQGAMQRIYNLMSQAPRSWIEETLARQMVERPRTLMWVKGHGGVAGNEEADRKAKMEVKMGERMCRPDIILQPPPPLSLLEILVPPLCPFMFLLYLSTYSATCSTVGKLYSIFPYFPCI